MPHLKDEPLVILKDQSVTSVQNKRIGGMGGWGVRVDWEGRVGRGVDEEVGGGKVMWPHLDGILPTCALGA